MIEKFFARGDYVMPTRQEAIFYCKSFDNVIEDYPFHDNNMIKGRGIIRIFIRRGQDVQGISFSAGDNIK